MTSANDRVTFLVARLGHLALGIGLLLVAVSGVGAAHDLVQFHRSYLVGVLFVLGPAGGALGLLMLHRLTGGRWGEAIQEILYSAARTLPYFSLMLVPVLLGLESVFPWAEPGWRESSA
ncbi:MAG TPA: hypothetical protein PKI99_02395, partial [Terrimesophilobacter sp.]|nr:hypothetical protein [Terrimesophilobacter sp.]